MARRSYRWIMVTLAVLGLAADQGSKYGMFAQLYNGTPRGEREVVDGWFKFTVEYDNSVQPCDCWVRSLQTVSAPEMPRVNHGALFGLGGEHKSEANQVFAGISMLAAAGILVWVSRKSTGQDRWLCAALGLIFGGTLGNLYDRLVFNGVRDFLYFYKVEWPVFNVADCCLVVGAFMLLAHAFFSREAKAEVPAPTAGVPPGPANTTPRNSPP